MIKKKYKIILWVCAALAAFFLLANILIGSLAPRIIQDQIKQNLKIEAKLGRIYLGLPFTVNLERLEIGDLASIKKISFSPNLAALLFGKIVIHGLTVTEPVISLEQSSDGKMNLPVLEQKGKAPEIYLTSLRVVKGKIIFKDKKVSGGFSVIADDFNFKISKVALPLTSLAADFQGSLRLVSSGGEAFGGITFGGWLDYPAKNLDAKLEISGMDVTKFSVYYGNFISSRKLNSARLDMVSTFKSQSNALRIATKFNLSNLVYAPGQEKALNIDLAKNALDVFTDASGSLHLEFVIDTALDKPELNGDKLRNVILKAAAKNLAEQPPEQLINKVATIIDQYRGLGKEIKTILGQ